MNLVQFMVVAAMSGVLTMGMAQSMNFGMKSHSGINAKRLVSELGVEVRQFLNNQELCDQSFANHSLDDPISFAYEASEPFLSGQTIGSGYQVTEINYSEDQRVGEQSFGKII